MTLLKIKRYESVSGQGIAKFKTPRTKDVYSILCPPHTHPHTSAKARVHINSFVEVFVHLSKN